MTTISLPCEWAARKIEISLPSNARLGWLLYPDGRALRLAVKTKEEAERILRIEARKGLAPLALLRRVSPPIDAVAVFRITRNGTLARTRSLRLIPDLSLQHVVAETLVVLVEDFVEARDALAHARSPRPLSA